MNQYAQSHHVDDHLETAVLKAADKLKDSLESPDLVVVFAAGFESGEVDVVFPKLHQLIAANTHIGCTCESVIGGELELENQSVISIWAAKLGTGKIEAFHLDYERTPDGGVFTGWPADVAEKWQDDSKILLLGDPYSFPADVLLEQLNEDRPGVPVIGGMSSGASRPGESRLLLNDSVHSSGGIVTMISGVPVSTVVSQGCRPIGEPYVITESERNIVSGLGGRPALQQLQELFRQLPARDQRLINGGLHLGIVTNEYQSSFAFGDFLIRNVMSIDEESQAILIGDYVRTGQTVQFHIRDHESASVELSQLLTNAKTNSKAALLFTCNGRGLNLFPDPHHDAGMVQNKLGEVPTAGFFAAGEIGPVSGKNFLHGFTASLALFG